MGNFPSPPQLVGEIDDRDDIIEGLREKNRRLDEALRLERNKAGQAESGVKGLRRLLTPLYRALQQVFGEIDAMGIADAPTAAVTANGAEDPRWRSFKERFPDTPAEIVDALLTHRQMSITELSGLLKAHYNTVNKALATLTKAGAVVKDGGRNGKYSLKF